MAAGFGPSSPLGSEIQIIIQSESSEMIRFQTFEMTPFNTKTTWNSRDQEIGGRRMSSRSHELVSQKEREFNHGEIKDLAEQRDQPPRICRVERGRRKFIVHLSWI
jgi:hypothetical protein